MEILDFSIKIVKRIQPLLPGWMQRIISVIGRFSYSIIFKNGPFKCPVCGNNVKAFLPLPDFHYKRKEKFGSPYSIDDFETLNYLGYSCPLCKASDRERLYAIYLNERFRNNTQTIIRFLDIAPSKSLTRFIRRLPRINYRSADINEMKAMDKVDITQMNLYDDNSFDVILCSHVLEHVPDDRKAVAELYRVLKNGGWGILMVPINSALEKTDEDPTLIDASERIRRFGQEGHVRPILNTYRH